MIYKKKRERKRKESGWEKEASISKVRHTSSTYCSNKWVAQGLFWRVDERTYSHPRRSEQLTLMAYRTDRFVELHRCSNVPVGRGKIIFDAFLKKKERNTFPVPLYCAGFSAPV